MLEEARHGSAGDADAVEVVVTGAPADGAYHCSSCGYGVAVQAALPLCPMCGGTTWEPADVSPGSQPLQ